MKDESLNYRVVRGPVEGWDSVLQLFLFNSSSHTVAKDSNLLAWNASWLQNHLFAGSCLGAPVSCCTYSGVWTEWAACW